MYRLKVFITAFYLTLSGYLFSQSPRKIKKNLSILVLGNFDTAYSFRFEPEIRDKPGWDIVDKNFKEAFSYLGFKLSPTPSNHCYSIILDYYYGYIKSAYKKRYKDLRGKIVDSENPSKPVGTLYFNGMFQNETLSDSIAIRIGAIIKKQATYTATPLQTNYPRSKEDRLRELKDLLDKGLINNQDYEDKKTKILKEL